VNLESTNQVETILSSISDGIYVLDRNWRFTFVNDRYCAMVGMERNAILGHNVWDLFPAAVDTEAYVQLHRAIRDQTPIRFDYLYAPWNCWHDHRLYPCADGLTVFLADITARKQAELLLSEQNRLMEMVACGKPLEDCLSSVCASITKLSPGTQACFLLTDAECKTFQRSITSDLLPSFRAGLKDAPINDLCIGTCGEAVYRGQPIACMDIANDDRWSQGWRELCVAHGILACHSQPVMRNGAPLGSLMLCFDTARMPTAWEYQLAEFGTRVASIVFERDRAEAEREKLLIREQAAREEAERANRIKDEFLAVLSHELRSPLNPILGWTKLLRAGRLDAARSIAALATIERNATLQCQLIEDLLDVSRILRGKLSLTVAPVVLSTAITAAIETVRLAAEAKQVQIQTRFDSNVQPVSGDVSRLQQVVWNLLSNAVKFTPAGGRVEIRLTQVGHLVQIIVSDTGKGISAEFLPDVFEHFRQEDGSTTRQFGGLGLGLAIARQIVELHGGRIWVNSNGQNQGATFTVELPASPTLSIIKTELPNPDHAKTETDLSLRHLRVLIVDDEPDSRDFVAFLVEHAGAEVVAVSSAIEALQQLLTSRFDLLLSDIGMPEMDGYALLRHLRQLSGEQGGKIPAIALTAYAGEVDQKQALQVGFQRHLPKPIDPEELVKTIRILCDGFLDSKTG